jgi:RNA polymerase sigma-70 factor (ECF subfamily)
MATSIQRAEEVPEDGSREPGIDAALVERVRGGDPAAFDRLVRRHLRVAHSAARRHLNGNHHDADDVVQEAFIRALQKIDTCRTPERFRAWLLSIVRTRAHAHREREAVRETEHLDELPPVASGADASRRLEINEFRQELDEAMTDLTELQRRTFVLYDMEGRSHAEVAEELGISRGASRFHLHRARKRIRSHLTHVPIAWRDR